MRELSFTDPRLARRLQLGALLAAVGAVGAALPDVVRAATGPRFQVVRGTEYDVWVAAAAVAGAVALACLIAATLGPLWRRRGFAGLLAALCGLLPAAAQSVAAGPHAPAAYHVRWPTALLLAALTGAVVACLHPALARTFARDVAAARRVTRADRDGTGQRGAG